MVSWYGLDHQPISMEEANDLLGDPMARRVALTEIGPYVVSTVFLVLDHSFGEGPPVLYETMVFTKSAWEDDRDDPDHELLLEFDCQRYHSLDEAQLGHDEMCLLIRATLQDLPSESTSEEDCK